MTYCFVLFFVLPDKPMHLNDGRFMQNGRCGFVLMPDCMFEPGFNPMDTTTHTKATPITFTIQVIGGRHLIRTGRGICSPLVEVEVCGIDADWAKFRTSTCSECIVLSMLVHNEKNSTCMYMYIVRFLFFPYSRGKWFQPGVE